MFRQIQPGKSAQTPTWSSLYLLFDTSFCHCALLVMHYSICLVRQDQASSIFAETWMLISAFQITYFYFEDSLWQIDIVLTGSVSQQLGVQIKASCFQGCFFASTTKMAKGFLWPWFDCFIWVGSEATQVWAPGCNHCWYYFWRNYFWYVSSVEPIRFSLQSNSVLI